MRREVGKNKLSCSPIGAVIGPLVICGVVVEEADEKRLREIKVRDSKLLSPSQREKLKPEIERLAKRVLIVRLEPERIDNRKADGINLNKLETLRFAEIINRACAAQQITEVIIDVPDVNIAKFKSFLKKLIPDKDIKIVAEHYADKKYPVCSAASIIAKVTRDADVELLKKDYGNFGSGYPSDPTCVKWLEDWLERYKKFPPVVRHSWETIEKIKNKKSQRTLKKFFKTRF